MAEDAAASSEKRIVFGVWRRHHTAAGRASPNTNALHQRQAIRVQMLDDLNKRGGIRAGPSIIPIRQRSMQEQHASFRRTTGR